MSTIPSFPNINDLDVQAALQHVGPLEVGTVLNDHYSPDFYTERRAKYLGRCQTYAQLRNGLFTIACEDSDVIFGSYEGDLSVQEVRRREICNGILPLLPFPTDQNTATLDGYGDLPDSEWADGKEGLRRVLTPTPSPPPAPEESANAQTMNAANPASATGNDESNQQANADNLSRDQHQGRHVRFAEQTDMVDAGAAGTAQPVQRPDDAVLVAGILDNLERLYATNNASTTNGASSNPGVLNGQLVATPAAQQPVPAAANRGAKRAPASSAGMSAPSYANRPTNTRMKVRRGTKRSHPDDDDDAVEYVSTDSEAANDSSASADDAAPKKKKLKFNAGPRPTKQKAAQRVDSRASSEMRDMQPRRKASTAPKKKKNNAATTTTTTTGKASGRAKHPTIDAIISGTALPRSRAQATEADEARYALLVEARNTRSRARKNATANDPELMPEYFQTSRFPADAAEDQVRCVCGVVADDHMRMVCCDSDGCSVWQHVACVGDAVPKDLENGAYRCHNCDPWAHRRAIQSLRKANVVTARG